MANVIMIQGTMSNVGKSVLTAGLCRLFTQDGYRTVPFKSQNMSSIAHTLADGGLMSRAQAIQAEACGVAPEVSMNPILLKPVSDQGAEVIVRGRSRGVMSAADYFAARTGLIGEILDCFESVSACADIVVVEGAGSPAEINLNRDDIVNMGLARRISAPVILVGDINPGGVFAQLAGTLWLLGAHERCLVKGTVVNKFRGDITLLRPGLAMLEEKCGVPCLGVLPYLELDIEPEDSLSRATAGRTEDAQFDLLADAMRKHLKVQEIYDILEAGL